MVWDKIPFWFLKNLNKNFKCFFLCVLYRFHKGIFTSNLCAFLTLVTIVLLRAWWERWFSLSLLPLLNDPFPLKEVNFCSHYGSLSLWSPARFMFWWRWCFGNCVLCRQCERRFKPMWLKQYNTVLSLFYFQGSPQNSSQIPTSLVRKSACWWFIQTLIFLELGHLYSSWTSNTLSFFMYL